MSKTMEKLIYVPVCRLRHGLNENCLLSVFEYLEEFDLINLSAMDAYYKELILKWIIKKKLLDLTEPNEQLKIFQAFGKSMRKFKIYTCSFTSMLASIVKYCEPGALTEMYLEINDQSDDVLERIDAVVSLNSLTKRAMPFFSNLRKFKFTTYKSSDSNGVLTNFLTEISTTALNLQSFELTNFAPRGNWLQNMQKITELRIFWRSEAPLDNLLSYLRANPQLKVFEFRHKLKNPTAVFDVLSESCPALEKFSDTDVDMSNPYQRFDDSMFSHYKFLSKFPHLNSVKLMSHTFCGCDLYFPLVSLATKNIVKLKVLINLARPIVVSKEEKAKVMRRPLPQFLSLHSIEIEIWEHNVEVFDPKFTQCDLRCQFLFHFLKNQKNVQYFKFVGSSLSNIHKALEFVPSIRVLDLSQAGSPYMHIEMPKMVDILRRARQLDDHKMLHLIVKDTVKFRIFSENNDWKDIIKFTFSKRRR